MMLKALLTHLLLSFAAGSGTMPGTTGSPNKQVTDATKTLRELKDTIAELNDLLQSNVMTQTEFNANTQEFFNKEFAQQTWALQAKTQAAQVFCESHGVGEAHAAVVRKLLVTYFTSEAKGMAPLCS